MGWRANECLILPHRPRNDQRRTWRTGRLVLRQRSPRTDVLRRAAQRALEILPVVTALIPGDPKEFSPPLEKHKERITTWLIGSGPDAGSGQGRRTLGDHRCEGRK